MWKLPWHRGRVQFDCRYDTSTVRYKRYGMTTTSDWAPVDLELRDSGEPITALDGFPNLDAGLVALTHPLIGVFHRRDGKLGTYSIWHDKLSCTAGHVVKARIGLFDRLGIVPFALQSKPHSVLIQHRTEFTIFLPPKLFATENSIRKPWRG